MEPNQKKWIPMDFKRVTCDFSVKWTRVPYKLGLINYAREKGVILLYFPPHTTHRLQAHL